MKHIVVYTTNHCPFCESAKNLLKSKGYAFEERLIPRSEPEKWQELAAKTGHKTMPQIFIGDHFVGGFDELSGLNNEGKLDPLVNQN